MLIGGGSLSPSMYTLDLDKWLLCDGKGKDGVGKEEDDDGGCI